MKDQKDDVVDEKTVAKEYWAHVWAWRNVIMVVLVPALLLPLCVCFENDAELKVGDLLNIKENIFSR